MSTLTKQTLSALPLTGSVSSDTTTACFSDCPYKQTDIECWCSERLNSFESGARSSSLYIEGLTSHIIKLDNTKQLMDSRILNAISVDMNLIAPAVPPPDYRERAINFAFVGNNTGRIEKHVGPATWAKMSYNERYEASDIIGFQLDSVTLYSQCNILKHNKDIRIVTWIKRLTKTLNNDNAGHFLRQMDLEDRTMTLQTALILKYFGINVIDKRPDICGTMQLKRASATISAVFDEERIFDDLTYEGDTPLKYEVLNNVNLSMFSIKTLPTSVTTKLNASIDKASEQISATIAEASSSVQESSSVISAMLDTLASMFPSPSITTLLREQGLHIVAAIMDLAKSIHHGTFMDNALSLCIRFIGIIGIPTKLISLITSYLTSARNMVYNRAAGLATGMKYQAGESTGSIIAAIMGVMISGSALSSASLKAVGEMARLFNTMVISSSKLETLVLGLVHWLPTCAKTWLITLFPSLKFEDLNILMTDYRTLTDQVEIVLDSMADPMIVFETHFRELVETKHEAIRLLYKRFEDKTNDPVMRTMCLRLVKLEERLRKVHDQIKTLRTEKTGRPTPFVVAFYGDSGVGKSTVALKMANRFAMSDAAEQRVYVRNATDAFWSAYHNQDFVVIDDQGQETVQHEDLNEMFSMVSTSTFYPPMASLDNTAIGVKGTKFDSKVIFICTNNPFPAATGLYLRPALFRRRHMLMRVTLADEYKSKSGVPDPDSFPADFSHLRFTWMDSVLENKILVPSMNYEAFCSLFEKNATSHYVRENAVYTSSMKEDERTPLKLEGLWPFESLWSKMFGLSQCPAMSDNEAQNIVRQINSATSGMLDALAVYAFRQGKTRPVSEKLDDIFPYHQLPLAVMTGADYTLFAECLADFGLFDYAIRERFQTGLPDALNFEETLYYLKNFTTEMMQEMPITRFTTRQGLRVSHILMCSKNSEIAQLVR